MNTHLGCKWRAASTSFAISLSLALRLVLTVMAFGLGLPAASLAGEKGAPEVDVILWFDTEDYLLPADDDATLRLCQLLTERGIRATFKLVGEKARVLETRGRRDVIRALRKHDIGYHANFHSVHPTPTEYLANCGLLDGMAEFVRREGGGAADVRRILGVPTLACYGQPGSSWAPQAVAALRQIGVAPHGVPCYVDEGTHVGLDHQPFWYAGTLMTYHMGHNYTRMDLHDPAAVQPAKETVSEIAQRLGKEGGGLISIFYHPCEWVHREFWDGVNFKRGANPPREEWKPPPQRSSQETEAAFKRFAEYIDYIRSLPGVRWVTAGDLPLLYPDLVRREGAPENDLAQLAERICSREAAGLDIQTLGPRAYSVANQFELLALALDSLIAGQQVRFPLKTSAVLGPDAAPPSTTLTNLAWPAFRDAVRDIASFIRAEHRVPARVFIGAEQVAPADFLGAMAAAWNSYRAQGKLPTEQGVPMAARLVIIPEKYIAQDTPDLFGGWIIHKENFRAPKLMELARLQAWTLKPALRGQP
jgi:hypothetical protein